jgi:hypothetical protein
MTEKSESGTVEESSAKEEGQKEVPLSSEKAKEEVKADVDKKEGPPPGHPRFDEVYGKWKKVERTLAEKEKDIEALREHTFKLDEALRKIKEEREDVDIPEPDPVVDPDAHKKWREFREHKVEQKFKDQSDKMRMANLIEIESGIHEDYDDVIKIADREMKRNSELSKTVWGSANPARAAYKLGKKIMDEQAKSEKEEEEKSKTEEVERKKRIESSSVESGSPTPVKQDEPKITDDEKRVIRNLFPHIPYKEAEKKYLAHRSALGR